MSSISSVGSGAYQQAMLSQQIQMATLAKSNDAMEAEGQAILELLESVAEISAAATEGQDIVG